MNDLPRALRDFAPPPGVIKADYTDFTVEELPLYPFDGTGTHTCFLLEKAGLTTRQATRDLARALNRRQFEIGFAGQKDARAVTRQWMTIEHVEPERLRELEIPRLRIVEITKHHNKLHLGHLSGNRFLIKVRETTPERLAEVQAALAELGRIGVPNYFGEQRFGMRGDTWEIGRAIVRNDADEAIDLLLGRSGPLDHGRVRQARELYDKQQYESASRAWPGMFYTERQALKGLLRTGGNRRKALHAIDRSMRNFYVSAYQSYLFNQVVAARVPAGLGTLLAGDLAWRHASGAVFRVEDLAGEQKRADTFEISPTGPLFGYRMTEPTESAGELEGQLLTGEGLNREVFHAGALRVKGSRRPLRFQPGETNILLGADERGPYLELRFTLSSGCFATAVLRELFQLQAGSAESGNEDAD